MNGTEDNESRWKHLWDGLDGLLECAEPLWDILCAMAEGIVSGVDFF